MTRNELIKYLKDNFDADEEINFVYWDDGDDVRTTKCIVETHRSQKIDGHYEWLELVKDENGNLVKKYTKLTREQVKEINTTLRWNGVYLTRDEIYNRMRWCTENIINDDKKCLFIDYE